jgi:hypothetical protein
LGNNKAIIWLKISFLIGAVTDALALIPMVISAAAKIFWGFSNFSGIYYFAMGMGASLMLAWTILLFWAYRKPLERRYIALFTIIIVTGFVITEIVLSGHGDMQINKFIGSLAMQAILLALFGYSFFISGKTQKL